MTTLNTIHKDLRRLDPQQLDAVAGFIADLLSEPEEDQEEESAGTHNGNGRKPAGGHVELKMINNCGPYAYLRWWEGKRLRSKYMGKVQEV